MKYAAALGLPLLLTLLSVPAAAHPLAREALDSGLASGFLGGFTHPFTGFDHLLALLGVGLWHGQRGAGKAQPLAFLALMLVGALSGAAGLVPPGLEIGLAASVALIGLVVALALAPPAWLGIAGAGFILLGLN